MSGSASYTDFLSIFACFCNALAGKIGFDRDSEWVESTIILLLISIPFSRAISIDLLISISNKFISLSLILRNLLKVLDSMTLSSGASPRKYLYDISHMHLSTRSTSDNPEMLLIIKYLNILTGSSAILPFCHYLDSTCCSVLHK